MKTILRSSCLCLFYLVQTFIKSLLYVTQYSRSFCVCRLSQPIPIQIYTSLACDKYFCVSFVFLQKKMWVVLKSLSSILPKLGPAYPQPQGSLCLFFPTSTLPIPPKPFFRRFPSVLTSYFTGLPANASSFSPQLTLTSPFQIHCPIIAGPTFLFASYTAVKCDCRGHWAFSSLFQSHLLNYFFFWQFPMCIYAFKLFSCLLTSLMSPPLLMKTFLFPTSPPLLSCPISACDYWV